MARQSVQPVVDPPREAPEPSSDPRSLVLWAVGAVAAAVVLGWLVLETMQVLLLVYTAGLLAVGLGPLVSRIERQTTARLPGRMQLPRWAAILVVYVAILAVAALTVVLVVPTLIEQTRALAQDLPAIAESWQRRLVSQGFLERRLTMGDVVQQAPVHGDALGAVLLAVWGFFGGVIGVVTVLVLAYYLVVDADDLFNAFVRLFPRPRRRRVRAVAHEIALKVSAWLNGQLVLSGVIGATSAIGLGLLGVPYFYVLALVAALGELIPYVGPLLAAIPAIGFAATVSWELAAAVAVFCFAQQQVENYILVPRIMQQQVGLSAVAVIIAVLVGAELLGIVGVILAVPTAAILQVLYQELRPDGE